jgi:hypothetical protein
MRRLLPLLPLVTLGCNPGAFEDFVAAGGERAGDAATPVQDAAPDARDAAGPGLDAGGPASDASTSPPSAPGTDDAQVRDAQAVPVDSGTPAPTIDECGQVRPRTPAQSAIQTVSMAGTIPQSDKVQPRWSTDLIVVGDDAWWLFGLAYRPSSLLIQSTDSITRTSRAMPFDLSEAAPDAPAPAPFLAPLDADRAQLLSGEQLVHNTGNVLLTSASDGLLFYDAGALGAGFAIRNLGTRVAKVHFEAGQARATPQAQLVFGPNMAPFRYGVRDGGYVYLYACPDNGFSYECMVARAREEQATDGASYQFRTTGGWSSDFSAATIVMNGARDELSVSFNPYLQRWLAVHLFGFNASSELHLRTAPKPEGPWEPFGVIPLPPPEGGQIGHFGGIEHPELATLCGRKLALTYLFGRAGDVSELRRLEVLLR